MCSCREMEKGWAEITNFTQSATHPSIQAKSVMHMKGDGGYLLTACKSLTLALRHSIAHRPRPQS